MLSILIPCSITVVAITMLWPMVKILDDVAEALCGGDRDFVWLEDSAGNPLCIFPGWHGVSDGSPRCADRIEGYIADRSEGYMLMGYGVFADRSEGYMLRRPRGI